MPKRKEDIKAAAKELKYQATHATKSEHKAAKRVEKTAMLGDSATEG